LEIAQFLEPEEFMNTPAGPLKSEDVDQIKAVRGPEIGPALKRDMLLQRVRAARKRLSPIPSSVPRLR
jgi:hypothetical protein